MVKTVNRPITHLIVCYWTAKDKDKAGMKEIDAAFRRAGYLGTPYHYCVRRNGTIEPGRMLSRAGRIDHPEASNSINVVIVLPPDDSGTGETARYTSKQREAAEGLLECLQKEYPKAHMESLGPTR